MVIFALFASGFNLLFGHVGELSFGHAMFFTIGAYSTALFSNGFNVQLFGLTLQHGKVDNVLVALILSIAIALLWAWLLARLVVPRSSGIYFSMITLAFAQVIYFITYRWSELTGGEDGLQNIARPNPIGSRLAARLDALLLVLRGLRLPRAVPAVLDPALAVRQRAARDPREQAARALPRLRRRQVPGQRVRALGAVPGDRRLAVDVLPAGDQPRRRLGGVQRQRGDDVAAGRDADVHGPDSRRDRSTTSFRTTSRSSPSTGRRGSASCSWCSCWSGRAASWGCSTTSGTTGSAPRSGAASRARRASQTDMQEELPPVIEDRRSRRRRRHDGARGGRASPRPATSSRPRG